MILEVDTRKPQIALCGEMTLEEATNLSKDGLLNDADDDDDDDGDDDDDDGDDAVFLCFRPTCSVYER